MPHRHGNHRPREEVEADGLHNGLRGGRLGNAEEPPDVVVGEPLRHKVKRCGSRH